MRTRTVKLKIASVLGAGVLGVGIFAGLVPVASSGEPPQPEVQPFETVLNTQVPEPNCAGDGCTN